MYYTVLYWKISGLWCQYNTYSTNVTYETRAPLRGSVSYQPKSNSDPALEVIISFVKTILVDTVLIENNLPLVLMDVSQKFINSTHVLSMVHQFGHHTITNWWWVKWNIQRGQNKWTWPVWRWTISCMLLHEYKMGAVVFRG